MSLVYRAIWREARLDAPEFALACLQSWVQWKTGGTLAVPEGGKVTAPVVAQGRVFDAELRVQRASGAATVTDSLDAELIEQNPDQTRWETTLRSWTETTDAGVIGWFWVDVDCAGPVELRELTVSAPRLARDLITRGTRPTCGVTRLSAAASLVKGSSGGQELASEILDPDRDVPLVVFSNDPERMARFTPSYQIEEIARRVARQLAGVAVVRLADTQACWSLTDALGDRDFGVWHGAFRMYRPKVDTSEPGDSSRHRYVVIDQYARSLDLAGRILGNALGIASGTRRPPQSYSEAHELIRQRQAGDTDLPDWVVELSDQQTKTIESLTEDLDRLRDDFIGLWSDWDEASEEISSLRAQLSKAQEQIRRQHDLLRRAGAEDTSWGSVEQAETEIPESANGLFQAATQARQYLSDRLVLPLEALRDLDDLDSAPQSKGWANTAWRGFVALHAYAADQANGVEAGSFWQWCAGSKNPRAWPASTKKLSMQESETVENNAALRKARMLPVSREVDEAGVIYMGAHLKIAEGGGALAPRIYFHWDPQGKKIHVGFFGPHKYMPNTKT